MKYFENFPKIITTDINGTSVLATNLLARVNIIPELLNNPLLYYAYDMQEGDRPDTIASKYYNNSYRYWIFLYGNNIMDPLADLPLSTRNFNAYMEDKYGADAEIASMDTISYTQFTVYQYQKVVSTTDSETGDTTVQYIPIDLTTYQELPELQVYLNFFSDGTSVSTEVSKRTISIFDYENDLNESKRQVNLVNNSYASSMEQKLKSLMNS